MPMSLSNIRRLAILSSAGLLALGCIYWFLGGAASSNGDMGSVDRKHGHIFEAVPGDFMQDDTKTDPETFDYTKHNLGLITTWDFFKSRLSDLNTQAPPDTSYKLFYLARHGQGYHNVAESFYGTKAWDDYWSKLDGNGTSTWSDAQLTPLGEQQARDAGAFFQSQIAEHDMPLPERWVVSPLMRCLHTCELTWGEVSAARGFLPLVKEDAREVMGEHTCDRRSSRTVIHEAYAKWFIEEGFTEKDELWQADHRETHAEHDKRTQQLLDDVFNDEPESSVISLTIHSGAIASFLRVTGHRTFPLPTGGLIPVLVRGRRI